MKRKKYMPVTYVTEEGEIIDKETLKNHSYITKNLETNEEKRENEDTWIYTIRCIKITGTQCTIKFN